VAAPAKASRRGRGSIETLPSGSLRVKVYAGVDPVTKTRLYLDETIPPGPRSAREAEKVRTRLLAQVDEKRNPRTRATVGQLLDKYLTVLDVEPTTRSTYEGYIRNHIRPVLGTVHSTRAQLRWPLPTAPVRAPGAGDGPPDRRDPERSLRAGSQVEVDQRQPGRQRQAAGRPAAEPSAA
jgi:hypothetical protein